jgi:hypothetical protein
VIAMLSLSAALGGCLYPSHGAVAGPTFSVMFITHEPPPVRVDIVTTRRSDDEVWISGHWSANKNDYTWTKGRWTLPENGKKEWQDGKWEHEDRGWHYTEGSWR